MLTNYLETKLLEHSVGKRSYTAPTATYVGLFTTSPTDSTPGEEVSGEAYLRKTITWASSVDQVITNLTVITFPAATSDWGTVTAAAVLDGAVSGNILYYGPLEIPRHVDIGHVFQIGVGELELTLD